MYKFTRLYGGNSYRIDWYKRGSSKKGLSIADINYLDEVLSRTTGQRNPLSVARNYQRTFRKGKGGYSTSSLLNGKIKYTTYEVSACLDDIEVMQLALVQDDFKF